MKVALTCGNFPPEFLGGTERVVIALARKLREAGDEVLILTGSEQPLGDEEVSHEEWDGFQVRRFRRPPDEVYGLDLSRPRLQAAIDKVLAEEGVEVTKARGRRIEDFLGARRGSIQACYDFFKSVAAKKGMLTEAPAPEGEVAAAPAPAC